MKTLLSRTLVNWLPAVDCTRYAVLAPINVTDALELTMLTRKDRAGIPRVVARWLLRYLEERDEVTIEEAAMASCLLALSGDCNEETAADATGHGPVALEPAAQAIYSDAAGV